MPPTDDDGDDARRVRAERRAERRRARVNDDDDDDGNAGGVETSRRRWGRRANDARVRDEDDAANGGGGGGGGRRRRARAVASSVSRGEVSEDEASSSSSSSARRRAAGARRTKSPVVYGMAPHPKLGCSVPEDLKYRGSGGFGDWRYRCPCEHARAARERGRRASASGASMDETSTVGGVNGVDEYDGPTCASHALSLAWRGFTTAYMTRAGISLAAHAVRTLRGRDPRKAYDLKHLVGESSLKYREDAVRFGLFTAFFVGGYSATRCWLCYATAFDVRKVQSSARKNDAAPASYAENAHVPSIARAMKDPFTPESAAAISGGVAGLSIFFLKPKYRRAFSLFLLAKLAQAGFASAQKERTWLQKGTGSWKHANFALFALSSAQIMYAYVMRPDTLDAGFWNFIVQAGPIDKKTLSMVRESAQKGATSALVGCEHTHKSTGKLWCSSHVAYSSLGTFRKCFPFYFSIHYVPYMVLNFTKAMSQPIRTLYRATKATVRSTAMLSTYVGLYMSVVCAHRNAGVRDHRALYYIAGAVASTALFVENDTRRTDLTLWIVPRAMDSLVLLLVHKGMLPRVPNFESYLFALVMAGVMNLYETEPDVLEKNLARFIARFVEPSRADGGVRPHPGISRDASVSLM